MSSGICRFPPRDSSISLFVRPCEFLVREQAMLFFSRFGGSRALLVVVRDMVDAVAHRIAAHLPGVEGLQEFADFSDVGHPRIDHRS
jgi:hypothetical protein